MIYDFKTNCKTYSKNSYTSGSFYQTACPGCRAIGRFHLHGSYARYVVYVSEAHLVSTSLQIRRVRCKSCGGTHAVLPWDVIPYRLLSLSVVLLLLFQRFSAGLPVLQIAASFGFSHQFLYGVVATFARFYQHLFLFFRQSAHLQVTTPTPEALLNAINTMRPQVLFQAQYMKYNCRPCFMCKFFNDLNPPYISTIPPPMPFKGHQHHF